MKLPETLILPFTLAVPLEKVKFALVVMLAPEATLNPVPPNEAALARVMLWLTLIVPEVYVSGGVAPPQPEVLFQLAAVVQGPLFVEV